MAIGGDEAGKTRDGSASPDRMKLTAVRMPPESEASPRLQSLRYHLLTNLPPSLGNHLRLAFYPSLLVC